MRRAKIHDAGCDPGRAVGAVNCGAMFGDKLSPLSDTTNLAPAVAGSRLGDHVRSMLYTTIPAFVVSLILFTLLGIQQTSGAYEDPVYQILLASDGMLVKRPILVGDDFVLVGFKETEWSATLNK